MVPNAAETLRRTILGFALDESVTTGEARAQLGWLFQALLPIPARSTGPDVRGGGPGVKRRRPDRNNA